jgi:uncharacterized membrane protein YphA (DoxX/SURF4 family)
VQRPSESRVPALYDRLSRGLYAAFFLIDGLAKIVHSERAIEGLSGMGLGYPELLNYAGAAIELAGALCLLTGFQVWAAALVLALYKLPASFLTYAATARVHPSHLLLLFRDLAFAGGLVLLAGLHRQPRRGTGQRA